MKLLMQKRIRRFLALPRNEKLLFYEALFIISKYHILLKLNGFNHIRNSIFNNQQLRKRHNSTDFPPSIFTSGICMAIERAARIIPKTSCLIRAFAAAAMLTKRGYDTELHIGICRGNHGKIDIHAWLTMDGQILTGMLPDLHDFQEFPLDYM